MKHPPIQMETKCIEMNKIDSIKSSIEMNGLTLQETEYLKELTEKELKAYHIAKKYLGTSFDLKKSNGFLKWKIKNIKGE